MKGSQIKLKSILVLLLQLVGLFLFKEGFLLSRLELLNKTSNQRDDVTTSSTSGRRFNKTILVMIDALRYDFMRWDEERAGKREIPHFLNKLEVLQRKLKEEPRNALLFRGLADPPTTTLQRLMAMMTGALPTLVDAGSNFASGALREDNLIEKILSQGKRVVSLGDDTWDRLFPSSINESYFYPSFDVWDLHSVDLGVLEHLMPMLEKKGHDWGFLIAHFLGVDHAGHRYGPGHVAMGDKLVQMNKVLGEIFDLVHPDTLVIVMGDHGMDAKGDHGGDSDQEVNAGLFFYSKTPLIGKHRIYKEDVKDLMEGISKLNPPDYDIFSILKGDRTVQQIDIVATISSLMGLGIPFGNLGSLIPEFFLGHEDYTTLLDETAHNSKQVFEYLDAYGSKRADAKVAFGKSNLMYTNAVAAHQALVKDRRYTKKEQLDVYLLYTHFLRHTLVLARAIWSRFEYTLMIMGVSILLVALLLSLRLYALNLELDFPQLLVAGISGLIIGSFSPARMLTYPGADAATITLQRNHEIIFFASLFLGLSLLFSRTRADPLAISKPRSLLFKISTVLVLLYTCTLGSDSFLIFEDFILLHFLQFIHLLLFFKSYSDQEPWKRQFQILACAVITRVISLVTICRPDQGPYCIPTYNDTPTSSISSLWTILPLIFLVSLAIFTLVRQSSSLSLQFTGSLFCSTVYWTIDTLESHEWMSKLGFKDWFVYAYWCFLAFALLRYKSSSSSKQLLHIGFMFLIMFQKPMGAIVLTLCYFYIQLVREMDCAPHLLFFMSWLVFFCTGHQNILPTIQYDVGFIGFKSANMILSPLYVALNTFGGPLLVACQLGFEKDRRVMWARQLAVAVIFTGHFSRHSQAFRVWGPKFLFFSAGHLLQSLVSLLCLAVASFKIEDEHSSTGINKKD